MPFAVVSPKTSYQKIQLLAILVLLQTSVFAQKVAPGRPGDKRDTAAQIHLMSYARLTKTDAQHSEFKKAKIPDIISELRACYPEYAFVDHYDDKAFSLIVPAYLIKITYECGDQHYAIDVYDAKYHTLIQFSYDFDGSFKQYFETHDDEDMKKAGSVQMNGQTIYRYLNNKGEHIGVIFSSNNLEVFYFTKSEQQERGLQEAICKFKW